MFETFEHTADLGLRVRASDLNELFAEAGRGLMSVLIDNPDAIRPERQAIINLDGTELDYLFFDWLNELLYRFECGHWLFADFHVAVNDQGLAATVRGEPLTTDRHQPAHEVKAITYHHLTVEQTPDGWMAEVIVDI